MSNTSSSNNDLNTKDIAVRVAVRVRPLVLKEVREGCQECLDVSYETPQVILRGTDKAFTFDYAFPSTTPQDYVYDKSVSKMVKELFKGYNVTILAYGQTGSGKTYSMGTSCLDMNENEMGIIPRAVKEIFNGILERTEDEILVKISFIELYKERVYDLLNTKTREETVVDIREDPRGGIKIVGLTEIPVTSLEEMMKCLEHGAMNRATGATAMNARSSRSHAIFSLHIEIGKKLESDNIISAKFHLVDLAGSERAKKTGATGERFKEGVNINKGLLALGNVISTLCGEGAKGHIPYRDSKLTRLLQDSLGGNSHTLMLACVSPADSNLEETLSTLRYADRARKIKNKPIVNRDPQAAELARLRQQVQQLQVQLISEKSAQESTFSPSSSEVNGLLSQMRILEEEDEKLMRALQTALDENTNMAEKALMAEMARDQLKTRLEELRAQTGNTVEILNKTLDVNANPQFNEQINLVKEIQKKIIDLQAEQYKRERAIVDHELSRHSVSNTGDGESLGEMTEVQEEGERGSPIKGEFGAAFTLRQAKLNEELQDLNRELAMKEELMTKMTANDVRFVAMKYSYERNLKEFEEQINHLQKEKEELMQKLRNAFHSNASNKISEQRRKRLQELEGLITGLKRKVGEQNKLLKIKEQSEQKVTKLSTEIQVAKLKEADRKKQYQIVKLERLHSKQQNVLKRKMEEAVAINKKLKDAMALQKACRERRTASKDIEGINGKIKCWLEGELEVVSVKKQAKKSLQTLMEDRKIISEQFTKLKCQLEKGEFPPLIQRELQNKKQNLESELQLRTAQISDMQMKMVEEDGDAQNKKRFDSVQTMVEAKCAMQFLFDAASEHQITVVSHESDIKELNSQYEEVCQNLQETETALKELKEEHQNELSRLSTEHEDKILFLLRQMPQTQETKTLEESSGNDASSDLLQRLKFQEEELSRLSHLHDLLQQKMEECEELQKRLQEAQTTLQTISTKAEKEKLDGSLKELTPTKMDHFPTPLRSIPKPLKVSRSESEDDSDDDDDEEAQDKTVDPDWRKTPLYKRIRQITSRGRKWQEDDDDDDVSKRSFEGEGVKRSSSGEVRCGCGKDCSSKICKCRKSGNACSLSCKCNALKCTNYKRNSSSTSDTSRETLLNSTFEVSLKKNEPLSEISINKKVRLDVSKGNKPQRTETENTDPLLSGVLAINIADLNFSMPPLWDSD